MCTGNWYWGARKLSVVREVYDVKVQVVGMAINQLEIVPKGDSLFTVANKVAAIQHEWKSEDDREYRCLTCCQKWLVFGRESLHLSTEIVKRA